MSLNPCRKISRLRVVNMTNHTVPEEDVEEEIVDFGEDNPYAVSDKEFAPVYEQFHRMVYWQAQIVANRTGMKADQDFIEDTAQDIFISVMRCVQKYKRQKFIVQCYKFLKSHPELIPAKHYNKALSAIWYWQMRAKLGPRHGFNPVHDTFLADAIDAIHDVAPDFEYSHQNTCRAYLNIHYKVVRKALGDNSQCLDFFMEAMKTDDTFKMRKYGKILNECAKEFSPLGIRPCRWRPFDMDEEFGPYVKKFIINHGNKSVRRRPNMEGITNVSIDEIADIIPDTRRSTSNMFHSSQMTHIRSRVTQKNDLGLSRTFDAISEGDSGGSIYNGSISIKGLKRRLQIPESQIKNHIEVIRALVIESGGLAPPEDPIMVMESLKARKGPAIDHKFDF